jgi:hypothetical protein
VPDKEGLCRERIRLNVDIGPSDFIHKRTFTDIGISSKYQCTGVDFDSGQPSKMLSDLFKICKGILLLLDDGGHPTELVRR